MLVLSSKLMNQQYRTSRKRKKKLTDLYAAPQPAKVMSMVHIEAMEKLEK